MKKKSKKQDSSNHTDDLSTNNAKYPNELARFSASIKNGVLRNIQITDLGKNIRVLDDGTLLDDSQDLSDLTNDFAHITPGTEAIWKNVAMGKIDMFVAQIGTTFDGRAVLDNDLLVTALVTYGFSCDSAMDFINDFAENSKDDKSSPIIMINSHISNIIESIEPFENI